LKDLLEKMVTPMPSKTLSLTAAGSLLGSVAGVRGLQIWRQHFCLFNQGRGEIVDPGPI